MQQAAAKFIHRIMRNKTPHQIYTRYQIPRRPRGIFELRPKNAPKTKRLERTLFNSSIAIYNRVPPAERALEYPQFRRKVKTIKFDVK